MNDFFFEKYLAVLNAFIYSFSTRTDMSFSWRSMGQEEDITFSRGKIANNDIIFEEHTYKDGFYKKNVTGFVAHGYIILAMDETSFDPGSTEWKKILAKYPKICFLSEYALRLYEECFQCVFSGTTNLYNIPKQAKDALLATNEVLIPPRAAKQEIQNQFCSHPLDTEFSYQAFLKIRFALHSNWHSPRANVSFLKVFMQNDPSSFIFQTKKRIQELLSTTGKSLPNGTNDPVISILQELLYLDRLYKTLHEVIGTHAEETLRLRDLLLSTVAETKSSSAKITYIDKTGYQTANVKLCGNGFFTGEFKQFWLGPSIDLYKTKDSMDLHPFLIPIRTPFLYHIFPWNKIQSIKIGKKNISFF